MSTVMEKTKVRRLSATLLLAGVLVGAGVSPALADEPVAPAPVAGATSGSVTLPDGTVISKPTPEVLSAKIELERLQADSAAAKSRLDEANRSYQAATDAAAAAHTKSVTAAKEAADRSSEAEAARAQARKMQATVNTLAASTYKQGSSAAADAFTFALASDPADALRSSTVLGKVSENRSVNLDRLQDAKSRAERLESEAKSAAREAETSAQEATTQEGLARTALDTSASEAQKVAEAQLQASALLVQVGGEQVRQEMEEEALAAYRRTSAQFSGSLVIPSMYLPVMQDAVARYCPALPVAVLAAQLKAESNFNRYAVGPAVKGGNALGMGQFMPGTWAAKGVDGNGDGKRDPLDPLDAIPSSAKYDCELLTGVQGYPGDKIDLMLAAYNAGPGNVAKFGGIPPFAETQNYVVKIRAFAASWTEAPPIG